jgi:hypothetical protein
MLSINVIPKIFTFTGYDYLYIANIFVFTCDLCGQLYGNNDNYLQLVEQPPLQIS